MVFLISAVHWDLISELYSQPHSINLMFYKITFSDSKEISFTIQMARIGPFKVYSAILLGVQNIGASAAKPWLPYILLMSER